MVFQPSAFEGMLYDVVSLTQADENNRLSRKIVSSAEEIPAVIKENYDVKPYAEATGKTVPGKNLVTLSKRDDEKTMINLFLLERAWPLSTITPEEKIKAMEKNRKSKTKAVKKEIDVAQVLSCPICGKKHRFVHVETEKTVRHALRKVKPFDIKAEVQPKPLQA